MRSTVSLPLPIDSLEEQTEEKTYFFKIGFKAPVSISDLRTLKPLVWPVVSDLLASSSRLFSSRYGEQEEETKAKKRAPTLDINLFRAEKGGDPELIRESQRRRFSDVEVVDEIIRLDDQWRRGKFELDGLRRDFNRLSEEVKKLKIAGADAAAVITKAEESKRLISMKELEVEAVKASADAKLETVGNLVHDSVPVSDNEKDNVVIQSWGERRMEGKLRNHVELCELLGIVDSRPDISGERGYYLKDEGVDLNLALVSFGLDFLRKRNYRRLQTPYFMRRDVISKCAQLVQFDDELYKVVGEGEDKYLIATAEQPLCAYHLNKRLYPQDLPIRYAGFSTCFRREVGSHGRDTLGIFRVHQFEKVEQFCITSPFNNDSWEMHEEMIKNAEDFYKELNIPFRVVSIVSGALNDAASKKYDLEGWFAASKTYRELVSCSNCTDYQSSRLGIAYGLKKNHAQDKQYVHMLNSTLTATQRTICCILENYQKEDGVEIPKALQPFLGGLDFIPFKSVLTSEIKYSKCQEPMGKL